jgi:Fusaric acid resistance protein-like
LPTDCPRHSAVAPGIAWLERVDPGTHRRVKGLRLITAFGLAWMMANLQGLSPQLPDHAALGTVAAGFGLWASVSEGRTTRASSSRDLALLVLAAVFGAVMMICLAPALAMWGRAGPELTLATGAFLVGYLRRFGVLGTGLGSQVYIGQLLGYGAKSTPDDLPTVAIAGLIAAVAAIVPRLLSGPAEQPTPAAPVSSPNNIPMRRSPELRMGLQAAIAALVIVVLNDLVNFKESAWAVTACTYVIAGTMSGTIDRVFRRIIGTAIGVPLGLACLPIALQLPLVIWIAAALAMVIYAMALPERYDIACGTLRIRPHRDVGFHRRNLGCDALRPRLGDADRRGVRLDGRTARFANPSATALKRAGGSHPWIRETRNETCCGRKRCISFAGVCRPFIWQFGRVGRDGNRFAAEPLRRAKRGRLHLRGDGLADLGRRYLPGQQRSISVCRLGELDRPGAIISGQSVARPQGA